MRGALNYTGNLFNLLNPFSLLLGVMTLTIFMAHGAIYLGAEDVGRGARGLAQGRAAASASSRQSSRSPRCCGRRRSPVAWPITLPLVLLAAVLWLGALFMTMKGRDGWAFLLSSGTILLAVTALFVGLFPNVMPSNIDEAYNLTVTNASSQSYTLTVMTIVAVVMTPIVLIYQGWTFWVFRKRISTSMIPPQPVSGRSDDRFANARRIGTQPDHSTGSPHRGGPVGVSG